MSENPEVKPEARFVEGDSDTVNRLCQTVGLAQTGYLADFGEMEEPVAGERVCRNFEPKTVCRIFKLETADNKRSKKSFR